MNDLRETVKRLYLGSTWGARGFQIVSLSFELVLMDGVSKASFAYIRNMLPD
jgi:hypothetical protein